MSSPGPYPQPQDDAEPLRRITERCPSDLFPNTQARIDPRGNGVADDEVWRRHRIRAFVPDLVRYAQERLAAGEGLELLRELGVNEPEFATAHGLGILPGAFREALSPEARQTLQDKPLGNAILVPALDEQGVAVDAWAVFAASLHGLPFSLLDPPQGLLLAKVASAYPQVVACDTLQLAARLFGAGQRNVILFRDAADARANAERLYRSGVRSATVRAGRDAAAITEALLAAGIRVTPARKPEPHAGSGPSCTLAGAAAAPSAQAQTTAAGTALTPPDPPFPARPLLVSYDAKEEQAIFKAGEARYTLEVALDSDSRMQVRLEHAGRHALDRFDMATEAQRRRFAASAALRTGVSPELIEEHLLVLLDEARQIQERQLNPLQALRTQVDLSAEEREEALAFLRRPDLLDAITADLEALGWAGEEKTKRLLYLVAVSRKLPKPLSATLRAPSGAGKSFSIETICELVPPEDSLHCSRLTDSSLYYQSSDTLRHKLLTVDEVDALSSEVAVALRVLQTRGALSHAFTGRDPVTGQTVTQFVEARGPVAVLTTTAGELEEQLHSRCYQLDVDDSVAQTARILEAQRRLRADPSFSGDNGRRERVRRRHHALQRLLAVKPVIIPFADRIEFPAFSLRFRREQERFLNLIEASALLHQHQRPVADGFVLASEKDFGIAVELAAEHAGRALDDLSCSAHGVFTLVQEAGRSSFTMSDLKALRPDRSRHWFRKGLRELLAVDLILSSGGGRGKARQYEPNRAAFLDFTSVEIRLNPDSGLAHPSRSECDNITPATATG